MTKKFQVRVGSVDYGFYEAADEQSACEKCAQDAGYKNWHDMDEQLERHVELEAIEV